MKANRIIIALVMLMAGMSSCQDWFDVSPKADVKAEDMFEAEWVPGYFDRSIWVDDS